MSLVNAEIQEKTEVWARMYNSASESEITINLANPQLTSYEMWDNSPSGVFYGSSVAGSLMELDNVFVQNANDTLSYGWLMNAPDTLIMAGSSEMWVSAPIITNPDYTLTSNLKIYKLTDLNFTIANLTNPICDIDVDIWQHYIIGMHNGYNAQLSNWGDLGNMENGFGSSIDSPFISYFHAF